MSGTELGLPTDATFLLDGAPDGVVIVDADTIIYANSMADTMFGASPGELVGSPLMELVPERHRTAHRAHTAHFRADPSSRRMGEAATNLFGRRLDGSEFPVEISLNPVVIAERAVVMASVRDITARLEAERDRLAVQQSLDQVRDAVFLFDVETSQILHVNRGAVEQTGYGRETLLDGMTPDQLLPDLLSRELTEILDALRGGSRSRVEIETAVRRRDGSELIVDLSIQMPTEAVLGGRRCFMAIAHDITERLADNERVAASERSFRAAFEDAPVPMLLTDMSNPEERTIVSVNTAFEQFLGYSAPDLIGRTVNDLLDESGRLSPSRYAAAAEQDVYRAEMRYLRKDGTRVWGDVAARTIDANGTPMRLTHVTDISRRVAAERDRDRREAQLALLADIRKLVLVEENTDVVLTFICTAGRALLKAAAVAILRPRGTEHLEVLTGSTAEGVKPERARVSLHDPFIGGVLQTGQRARSEPTADDVERIAEPLLASDGRIEGVLVAAPNSERVAFAEADIDLLAALALEAAVALELERVRADRRRLLVVED
ncbi:MAG: PAS domain S-box protein, partial [Acidimicrobiales bacterium]|nr:PAS domain S-box protein [Acidimicrobiales bacterium]